MREKYVFQTLSQIFVYGFSLASSYLLVYVFKVSLIGMLVFAQSLIGLFSLFTTLGFSQIYNQYNQKDNFEDYFSVLLFFKYLLLALNYIPLYFMFFLYNWNVDKILLLILLISSTIRILIEPFSTHLLSKLKIFKRQLPNIIFSILESLLKVLIALNYSILENPLLFYVLTQLLFVVIKSCFSLLMAKGEFKIKKLKPNIMKKFLKDTKPLILVNIISVFYANFKNVLIDISFGHETLAYFNFVWAYLIHFLYMITGEIKPLYLSHFSKKYQEKKFGDLEKVCNLIEKYSSILFIFILIFVFLNAKYLFELFLPNYLPSLPFLYILIVTTYIAGINRPYSMLLIPGKKQMIYSYYSVIKMFLMITAIIIFVPNNFFSIKMFGFGPIALCYILLTGWILEIFIHRYFAKKLFDISSYKKIFVHILNGLAAFIITYIIKLMILDILIENKIFLVIIMTLLALFIYITQLILFREIKRKDVRYILSLLNVKRYKNSFLDEIKKDKN